MTRQARALVHRSADGWLLGGIGVAAWVAVRAAGTGASTPMTGALYWVLASVAAMHFGASYHLAYAGGRQSLRTHPFALVVVPAALVVAAVAAVALVPVSSGATSRAMVGNLVLVVFTLTGWHYIKQAFGVAMLTVRARGTSVSKAEAKVLRYGLYPIWLYQALGIYLRGRPASYRGVDYSAELLPTGLRSIVWVAGLIGAVLAAAVIVRIGMRLRAVPPAGLWATYLAGALWFLAPPSYFSAGIVLSAVHGTQYLAVAHRAEVDRAQEDGERDLATWWICVFGGAVAAGLLLTTFLPSVLDDHAIVSTVPGLYATLLFVALNLHHYAIDAAIWRSGGEHVRRITATPSTRAETAPDPALAPA